MGAFFNVTEIPGHLATKDQLSIMMTRYHLAKKYSVNKDVLEIACGAGMGLGYIAEVAQTVVGGDIDNDLVNIARDTYKDSLKVKVKFLDAQSIPFADNSFDLILLYEAVYYIPNITIFLFEAQRVLRPGGLIILSTVNCEWHSFNSSPQSKKYYNAEELLSLFNNNCDKEILLGFEDSPKGSNKITSTIRKLAIELGLIPKTMKGKEILKRFFYGKLIPIPKIIYEGLGEIKVLVPYENAKSDLVNYKFLYLLYHSSE